MILSFTSYVARDRSHARAVCLSLRLCPPLSEKQTYRGTKDFWETLRILCSGVEEDLPNVSRPRLPLWGSEVGFGAWSSEKGLRGTGKVKSSDNGEQCEEKESNRQIARLFWSFPPTLSTPCPLPRISDDKGITLLFPRSLSSRCLSFSAHPPFCTYVSLTIVVLSFTMFFLAENTHLRREREFAPGTARTNGKSSHGGDAWKNHWRRHFATLWIFVILISPVSIICSRQSDDDLSFSFFFFFNAIFLRSVTEQYERRANNKEGNFFFLRGYEVPQSEKHFCRSHIFTLLLFFFLSLFLSISFFLSRNVPFSTCLFISLRLSSLSG